jgi:hypothetical protein
MRRSSTCALVAALLLGGCGTTDTPVAPTDQASAAGLHGGQSGHHRRFHNLEVQLLPPCDTVTVPPDTIPTDTIPTDTIPTDTTGIPTLRSYLGAALHAMGGSDHGSNGSRDSRHRHHRSHKACIDDRGHDGDGRHGFRWLDTWARWFGDGPFGVIKIPVPADGDTTVSLRTKLRNLAPNTGYLVQWAADTIPNRACSDTSWVTVSPIAGLQVITVDSNGNARQTLTENVPAIPAAFTVEVHFRVVDSATKGVTLVSRCHSFTSGP